MLTFMLPVSSRRGYGFCRVENELEELQNLVGGYIEVINLTDNLVMIVDEEGKLKNKRHNYIANYVFKHFFPTSQDFIVGNAVLVETNGEDFTNLGNENYKLIMEILNEIGL